MYLGLDIGTTATKAVLVDEHHAIVATATFFYGAHAACSLQYAPASLRGAARIPLARTAGGLR